MCARNSTFERLPRGLGDVAHALASQCNMAAPSQPVRRVYRQPTETPLTRLLMHRQCAAETPLEVVETAGSVGTSMFEGSFSRGKAPRKHLLREFLVFSVLLLFVWSAVIRNGLPSIISVAFHDCFV